VIIPGVVGEHLEASVEEAEDPVDTAQGSCGRS
jgi:hypothetical protein